MGKTLRLAILAILMVAVGVVLLRTQLGNEEPAPQDVSAATASVPNAPVAAAPPSPAAIAGSPPVPTTQPPAPSTEGTPITPVQPILEATQTPDSSRMAAATYMDPRVLASKWKDHLGETVYIYACIITADHQEDESLFSVGARFSEVVVDWVSLNLRLSPRDPRLIRDSCARFYIVVQDPGDASPEAFQAHAFEAVSTKDLKNPDIYPD